jgi:hypothetical protein
MCKEQFIDLLIQLGRDIILPFAFTLIGVVGAVWYGNVSKPKLEIQPSSDDTIEGPMSNGAIRRALRIRVKNVPLKRPFVNRQTAVSCHGDIVFLDENRKPVSEPMQIRWADSPEPIKYLVINNKIEIFPENNLVRLSKYIDIPPDESESCDLAIRFVGEDNAYGWCTDSYFHNSRHPKYKLNQGTFFAKIIISAGGSTFKFTVPFSNPAIFKNFDV